MLIIQFLNKTFKLYYHRDDVFPDVLKINGTDYFMDSNSKENQGFLGFFDWLRTDKSTIVGIRICYFEHQLYNKILMQYPYIIPTFENKCIELLFKGNEYSIDLSGDQDFTNNYVYKSEVDNYLFTFGLDYFSMEELNSLLKYCEEIG